MKILYALAVAWLAAAGPAAATLVPIDLSPAGGALNLGATMYTQDHAVGLAAANENHQPASSASGGEVGSGIVYDTVSSQLSFDIAYGSAFGFTDLSSDWSGGVHFHGPGAVNYPLVNSNAGVVVNLGGFHVASGPRSGRITGSVTLSAGQATDLFDNEIYLNIHSVGFPAGEIRGQLVPVPEPGTAGLAALGLLAFVLLAQRRRPAA